MTSVSPNCFHSDGVVAKVVLAIAINSPGEVLRVDMSGLNLKSSRNIDTWTDWHKKRFVYSGQPFCCALAHTTTSHGDL